MKPLTPHFSTSVVGSFPHQDGESLSRKLLSVLDIPDWPQLPRRTFRENMYVQYSVSLPAIVLDEENEKIFFDTRGDLSDALEKFYEKYIEEDLDAFALPREYAQGFYAMLELLRKRREGNHPGWVKGQVTGPISFGLTVTDQDLRSSLYHDLLADVIVKNMAMAGRWQARTLQNTGCEVFIFVDEPYMASFGSAFISLSRDQAVAMMDEVFAAIHQEGALSGVHCCANTDWSVLLETQVDILNLDAYGYLENLALYPEELRGFLDRGGVIAWGIVPNNDEVYQVKPRELADKLLVGLQMISRKAEARGIKIDPGDFFERSLIVPSCGLASVSIETADAVLETLAETGEILHKA